VKIAFGSDERTALTDAVRADLETRGHEVVAVGPPAGEPKQWAEVGREVGELVSGGAADSGVLFCWTGTGVSIAANKVRGVRAALCTDAETARGARTWNDANVLVMGLMGHVTVDDVPAILDAWFETEADPSEAGNIARLDS
jgi:ribose 5-phosphate isomerase B